MIILFIMLFILVMFFVVQIAGNLKNKYLENLVKITVKSVQHELPYVAYLLDLVWQKLNYEPT